MSPDRGADAPAPLALQRLAAPAASLTDQVIASVRDGVRTGALRPGELYSAYQLADLLGVSRSPVREALLRLAEAGMVTLERNRGFRVSVPGAREIAEIFQLRLLLEVEAARRAAARIDPAVAATLHAELDAMDAAAGAHDEPDFMQHDQRLHSMIIAAAGNRRTQQLVDGLRDATRLLGASTVDTSRSLHDIAAEHRPIVAAITAGDRDAAAAAMHAHLEHTARLLLAQTVREAGDQLDPDQLWAEVSG
jgi:DNA-binding GntR family transcriptional regulator